MSNQATVNLKQPQSLPILFFAELWERFSFYGMRALLVLYMVNQLLFSDNQAYGIYGAYTALVYTTPILGGLLSDRLLGPRKSIILGGIIMALGQFALVFDHIDTFYAGLALIITGNGLFKPNISALLGQFYTANDPRRDAGFTIFYVGVNAGAFLAPLICTQLGSIYGWKYAFGAAGVGMLIGLFTFIKGIDKLEDKGLPNDPLKLKKSFGFLSLEAIAYIAAFLFVPFASIAMSNHELVSQVFPYIGLVVLLYIIYILITKCNNIERANIMTLFVLMLYTMTFFAFYEQMGSSLNLFTDRVVDRVIFGWEIPTGYFQSSHAFFIIVLGGVFSMMWRFMAQKGREPSTPVKFMLGLVQLGLGFAAIAYGAARAECDGVVGLGWLLLGYFLHTTGELCLSPVGLSAVTKLSPARYSSLLMGVFFLSIAFANFIASLIAKLMSVIPGRDGIIDSIECVKLYGEVFGQIALIAIGVGLSILLIAPFTRNVFARIEGYKK